MSGKKELKTWVKVAIFAFFVFIILPLLTLPYLIDLEDRIEFVLQSNKYIDEDPVGYSDALYSYLFSEFYNIDLDQVTLTKSEIIDNLSATLLYYNETESYQLLHELQILTDEADRVYNPIDEKLRTKNSVSLFFYYNSNEYFRDSEAYQGVHFPTMLIFGKLIFAQNEIIGEGN